MRTVKIKVYTAKELKEKFPEGFKRAFDRYREDVSSTAGFWVDEIMDSLKGLFKASGITLKDWSIGPHSYSYVKFDMGDAGRLEGSRAMAWLENNLLSSLRIPYTGKRRWELGKYGEAYRPGKVKPCPFTGYCADDDFLKALQENVRQGMSLKDAFKNMAGIASNLMEKEYEHEQSEECFLDHAECNELEFKENGARL